MTPIVLKEYTQLQKLEHLELNDKDVSLQEKLEKKNILSISADPLSGKLQFTTYSHIGIAQFSNFAISIIPKFSTIQRLVKLIEYTYDFDLEILPESEIQFEGEENILTEIIISTFVKKCHTLMRQGLYKSYNLKENNVKFLRGKLLINQQILNQAKTKLQFFCKYDEFEFNNLENQIVLYCLKQSYRLTINEERKNEIRGLVQNFNDLVGDTEISLDDFKKINYNQMNHRYKKIHELCKLIINNIHITAFVQKKLKFTNSFFIDMNNVFETFVFKLLCQYYPLYVKKQQSSSSWKYEKEDRTIPIITDILIYQKDRHTIHKIIDTKYKTELSANDRYQLTYYARDYEKDKVYAILPKFERVSSNNVIAIKQNIQIKIRHIDIDKVLDWIYSKEDHSKEIQKYIETSLLD